jgi:hypothetical protein
MCVLAVSNTLHLAQVHLGNSTRALTSFYMLGVNASDSHDVYYDAGLMDLVAASAAVKLSLEQGVAILRSQFTVLPTVRSQLHHHYEWRCQRALLAAGWWQSACA